MQIVPILGNVKFQITLDPSSWIFDDRKIAYDDYYEEDFSIDAFLEAQNDDRAGVAMPRLTKATRKYTRIDWLKKSFVMPLKLFINNAEPKEEASQIQFEITNGETVALPLSEVGESVLQFSQDGKLLTDADNGPLIYLSRDKSNAPITQIKGITII